MPLRNIVFQVSISCSMWTTFILSIYFAWMICPLKSGSNDMGTWVYRTLVIFEIEVNPIPHGGSDRNLPPYQRNFCLYVFSLTAPLSQVLVNFALTTDFRSHILSIEVRINYQLYKQGKISHNNFFLFLNSAICDFLGFLTKKNKEFKIWCTIDFVDKFSSPLDKLFSLTLA